MGPENKRTIALLINLWLSLGARNPLELEHWGDEPRILASQILVRFTLHHTEIGTYPIERPTKGWNHWRWRCDYVTRYQSKCFYATFEAPNMPDRFAWGSNQQRFCLLYTNRPYYCISTQPLKFNFSFCAYMVSGKKYPFKM